YHAVGITAHGNDFRTLQEVEAHHPVTTQLEPLEGRLSRDTVTGAQETELRLRFEYQLAGNTGVPLRIEFPFVVLCPFISFLVRCRGVVDAVERRVWGRHLYGQLQV